MHQIMQEINEFIVRGESHWEIEQALTPMLHLLERGLSTCSWSNAHNEIPRDLKLRLISPMGPGWARPRKELMILNKAHQTGSP